MKRLPVIFILLCSCNLYHPPVEESDPGMGENASGRLRSLGDAYIAWYHANNPTSATRHGVHEFDGQLGRFTEPDIAERVVSIERYLGRLHGIDPQGLTPQDQADLAVLENHMRASLLSWGKSRPWERDPNFYRNVIAGGLYSLAALRFDTAERRLALATSRLLEVPHVLAAARANLDAPARLTTEIAIEEFEGTRNFLKTALAAAFAEVKDESLRAGFEAAQKRALDAVASFIDWLRRDLLPRSTGNFAIGEEAYRLKLLYEEMVDVSIADLLIRGHEILRSTQERMKALAGDRPIREVLREKASDHPAPEKLIEETRAMLEGLKQWASAWVDVPPDAACLVQETPEFRRSLSFASMETPGPFETVAKEAYYSVTLPDPSWSSERREQHMSFFSRASLKLVSVHEAYPGHYTQFLTVRNGASRVRKVFGCASFSEGWAHYCEQLYVETAPSMGPDDATLLLAQLMLALQRICRYIVGIEMHTRGMTYEKGVEFFEKEGYLERVNAEREARRGTADPTYLVYTLGKMEILKLRDEYLRKTGRTLRDFHNDFIRHGYPPIPVVRRLILGE